MTHAFLPVSNKESNDHLCIASYTLSEIFM